MIELSRTMGRLRASMGEPLDLMMIEEADAAVGVWRHAGVEVDLSGTATTQVILQLTGGQRVRRNGGPAIAARAGGVAVMGVDVASRVAVEGVAVTLQIVTPQRRRGFADDLRSRAVRIMRLFVDRDQRALASALGDDGAGAPDAKAPDHVVRGGLTPAAMRRVASVVDRHFAYVPSSRLTNGALAAAGGLSRHHFIRAFATSVGVTPQAWVMERRMDLARELLLASEHDVATIGDHTGFSSPAHFVAAFRQRLGVTPASFHAAACRYLR